MEDAATAEISRAQVWQWIRHEGGKLNDGRNITLELMEELKISKIEREIGKEAFKKGRFQEATTLFTNLVRNDEFVPF